MILTYEFPLAEIIYDFYDKLKSATRGYGTMDYEVIGFRADDLVKLDILVNNSKVDALSLIVPPQQGRGPRAAAHPAACARRSPATCSRSRSRRPSASRVIARETIKAVGKNVTAKCYGGDITRKRKLLEKQKEGKKRMKMVGNVEIPQKAFLAVLEAGEE